MFRARKRETTRNGREWESEWMNGWIEHTDNEKRNNTTRIYRLLLQTIWRYGLPFENPCMKDRDRVPTKTNNKTELRKKTSEIKKNTQQSLLYSRLRCARKITNLFTIRWRVGGSCENFETSYQMETAQKKYPFFFSAEHLNMLFLLVVVGCEFNEFEHGFSLPLLLLLLLLPLLLLLLL